MKRTKLIITLMVIYNLAVVGAIVYLILTTGEWWAMILILATKSIPGALKGKRIKEGEATNG